MDSDLDLGPGQEGKSRVVVVGAGMAGSTAALRAQQQGARVLLIDKSPDPSAGGNTRLSAGSLHAAGLTLYEDSTRILSRISAVTDGKSDPVLASSYSVNAERAINWLGSVGVDFETSPDGQLKRTRLLPRRLFDDLYAWPDRGPQRALMTLQRALTAAGGMVAGGAAADELIPDAEGGVAGVVINHAGRRYDVAADFIVLADGGFQANRDMLIRHIGPAADRIKLRGSPSGTGDAIRIAEPFGAALVRMRYFYGGLLHHDALTNDRLWPAPLLDSLLFGSVVVSSSGVRSVDEGLGGIAVANELSRQPDPRDHWLLIDHAAWTEAKGIEARELKERDLPHPMPISSLELRGGRIVMARELDDVATAIGAEHQTLAAEIDSFNTAITNGGRINLKVQRSGDARPVTSAPFRAIPIVPGITFTMGGLTINGRSQVLDESRQPIVGLLAAGSSTGGLQGSRTGGYVGGLSPALVFGLLAGECATE